MTGHGSPTARRTRAVCGRSRRRRTVAPCIEEPRAEQARHPRADGMDRDGRIYPDDYRRTRELERIPAQRQICPSARPDVRPAGGDQRHLPTVATRSRNRPAHHHHSRPAHHERRPGGRCCRPAGRGPALRPLRTAPARADRHCAAHCHFAAVCAGARHRNPHRASRRTGILQRCGHGGCDRRDPRPLHRLRRIKAAVPTYARDRRGSAVRAHGRRTDRGAVGMALGVRRARSVWCRAVARGMGPVTRDAAA